MTGAKDQQSTDPPSSRFWNNIRLNLTGATLIDFNLVNGVIADANFHRAAFSGDASFSGATSAAPPGPAGRPSAAVPCSARRPSPRPGFRRAVRHSLSTVAVFVVAAAASRRHRAVLAGVVATEARGDRGGGSDRGGEDYWLCEA